jgi:hypothetical protein
MPDAVDTVAPRSGLWSDDGAARNYQGALSNLMKSGSTTVATAALVIPVTHRFVDKATGGVEALTLANGVPGQRLTVYMSADAGDGTLTPATSSGFSTIVFADVGDNATVEYVDDTVGWVIVGTAGITAGPIIS